VISKLREEDEILSVLSWLACCRVGLSRFKCDDRRRRRESSSVESKEELS